MRINKNDVLKGLAFLGMISNVNGVSGTTNAMDANDHTVRNCTVCATDEDLNPNNRPNGNQIGITTTPCHHLFHTNCLQRWEHSGQQNANKCPNCRALLHPQNHVAPGNNITPHERDTRDLENLLSGRTVQQLRQSETVNTNAQILASWGDVPVNWQGTGRVEGLLKNIWEKGTQLLNVIDRMRAFQEAYGYQPFHTGRILDIRVHSPRLIRACESGGKIVPTYQKLKQSWNRLLRMAYENKIFDRNEYTRLFNLPLGAGQNPFRNVHAYADANDILHSQDVESLAGRALNNHQYADANDEEPFGSDDDAQGENGDDINPFEEEPGNLDE